MDQANALALKNAIGNELAVTALRHNGKNHGLLSLEEIEAVANAYGVLFDWVMGTYIRAVIPTDPPLFDIGEHLSPKLSSMRLLVARPTLYEDDLELTCSCEAEAILDEVSLPDSWFPTNVVLGGVLLQGELTVTYHCYGHLPTLSSATGSSGTTKDQVKLVWDAYLASLKEQNIKTDKLFLIPRTERLIKTRLRDYKDDPEKLLLALANWHKSSWHVEHGVHTLSVLLKPDNIERFSQLADKADIVDADGGMNW